MADGSITFSTALDNAQLEKELAKTKKEIEKQEQTISAQEEKKSPLVQQAQELEQKMRDARAEVLKYRADWAAGVSGADKEQSMAIEKTQQLEAEHAKVVSQIDKIDAKLQPAYTKLDGMKEKAGAIASELAAAGEGSVAMGDAINKAGAHLDKFFTRIKRLATRVLFFSVITMALRGVRKWFGNVIKASPQAAEAIARLKGALLTLVQPLVNVIIPAFTAFVNVLAKIVATIASVMSTLFGTTIEQSAAAAESLNNETTAIGGVGAAAKKARKDLAAFDEINKLTSDSTGGGGSSSNSGIAPDFSFLKDGLFSSLSFTLDDILFKWKDLTKEDVLAKIITALTTLAGTVIGFTLGGPGGAVIGIAIGAGLGLLISNLTFNGDGKLSGEEILKAIVIALGMLTGGILGFAVGGPGGAALGLLLGAGVALAINKIIFNNDGKIGAEEVLRLLLVALGALVGGAIGFAIGGPGGAAIGILSGAGAALAISGLIFNGDGVLSEEEVLSTLLIALGVIAGGIIGFVAGGPGGALVGALIGGGATLYLQGMLFDADGKVSNDFMGTLVSALGIAVGGAIGFAIGGPGGALVGALVGAGATLAIETLAFGWDGEQALNTILSLLNDALFIALGGVIGFAIGGPGGALLGMTIGTGIKLLINSVSFSDETSNKKAGYDEGKVVGDNATQGTKDSLGVHSPSTVYNGIGKNMMEGLANGISEDETTVTSAVDTVLSEVESNFSDWQTNFMLGFGTFKTTFESEWKSFWKNQNVVFVNVWNDILTSFQNGINNAVRGLNDLVSAANSLSDLTGKSYMRPQSIVVQKLAIPKLAQGAVIPPNREFLAVLGDQKSGTNIEAPLETIVQAVMLALQKSGMSGSGGAQIIENILNLDGETIYRNQKKVSRRHGTSLVEV